MNNLRLESGAVLINKYSQLEIKILEFNEAKNWYDAIRLTDGQSLAVGVNWSNFYELRDR